LDYPALGSTVSANITFVPETGELLSAVIERKGLKVEYAHQHRPVMSGVKKYYEVDTFLVSGQGNGDGMVVMRGRTDDFQYMV
ncbi:MAG: hypothetical protein AB1758_37830, partial [Candidatus Eremiobacterota bacterium]